MNLRSLWREELAMENNEKDNEENLPAEKYEVRIGRTLYIIERNFNPKSTQTLSTTLLRIMLQDKEK